MTCIVGLEDAGNVYLGGDSAYISGWSLNLSDGKVFTVGPFLVGCAGSPRLAQLVRYRLPCEWTSLPEGEDLDRFMAVEFIDALRQVLKDGAFAKTEFEVETTNGSEMLVGIRDRLYEVNSDYQAKRSLTPYNAIGSGQDVALGAMFATEGLPPLDRLRTALEAAAAHNIGVRGPFSILEESSV